MKEQKKISMWTSNAEKRDKELTSQPISKYMQAAVKIDPAKDHQKSFE